MSRRMTGSRERWRCAADVTKPLVPIETGYSAGDDRVKPEVGCGAYGAPFSARRRSQHAAVGASHPGQTPAGAVDGRLEDAPGEAGALTMSLPVPLEALEKVGDRRRADHCTRGHG